MSLIFCYRCKSYAEFELHDCDKLESCSAFLLLPKLGISTIPEVPGDLVGGRILSLCFPRRSLSYISRLCRALPLRGSIEHVDLVVQEPRTAFERTCPEMWHCILAVLRISSANRTSRRLGLLSPMVLCFGGRHSMSRTKGDCVIGLS